MKTNKVIRNSMTIIVLLIQVVILTLIATSNYKADNFTAILAIIIITTIVLFGHKYLDLHDNEYSYEKISIIIWAPAGAIFCYLLNSYTDFGSILSAGIVGTIASFIPLLNKKSTYLKQLPTVIYCGVFVGMSSETITPSIGLVVAAGVLAGVFLSFSKNLFIGIGGKLGTMAFIGVLIVYLINLFIL
jgi:intracellular septation protein A